MAIVELTHESNGVSLLRLNRPEARNALNWEAMDLFAEAVADLGSRPGLRVLLVTGEGEAFCSGGDLFELDQYLSRRDGERLARVMGDALQGLEALPVPTVAAVEGPALGGGAEIALACDIRVMARGSTLGIMHIRLGIALRGGGQSCSASSAWPGAGVDVGRSGPQPEEAERHGLTIGPSSEPRPAGARPG
jgi:enoyl-CoA hydratase/carnithine racemase